jgi:uncharacterized protein (TIGR03083 family)
MAAFMAALDRCPPDGVTGCREWTVHDVAAHLAGNAVEIARTVEAYAEQRPVPDTRGWDEREAPLRALDHATLLRRIVAETDRMNRVLAEVLAREPNAVVPWTQRQMRVASFGTHMRNEFALHRWDLVGDDDVSHDLLAQPELTKHSVEVLGHILPRQGLQAAPAVPDGFTARLRSPDASDVVLSVRDRQARLTLAAAGAGVPTLDGDAAARLLFMWGRRPADGSRLRSKMADADFVWVARLCAGY